MPAALEMCPFRCVMAELFEKRSPGHIAEFALPTDVSNCVLHYTADIPDLTCMFNIIRKHIIGIIAWSSAKAIEQVLQELGQLTGLFEILQHSLSSFSSDDDSGCELAEHATDQLNDLVVAALSHYETLAGLSPEQMARELEPTYVHLCLHLHWNVMRTLQVIASRWTGRRVLAKRALMSADHEPPGGQWATEVARLPAVEQHMLLTAWDLAILARLPFSRVARSRAFGDATPFSCSCVRDIWTGLVALLESNPTLIWSMLHKLSDLLIYESVTAGHQKQATGAQDSRTLVLPVLAVRRQAGAEFYLWLLRHVSPLLPGMQGCGGVVAHNLPPLLAQSFKRSSTASPQASSNYVVLRAVLEEFLKQTPEEAACASAMECVLILYRLWDVESDFSILQTLWNHFTKHLNVYSMPKTSLDMTSSPYGFSPSELLRSCKSYAEDNRSQCTRVRETAWVLFLRILHLCMRSVSLSGDWRKVFARLLVRFNVRTIQNLNEDGIYNFVKLCLVMTLSGDVQVSLSRLVDLLGYVEPATANCQIGTAVFAGACAAGCLSLERGHDVAQLADLLSAWLQTYCSALRQAGTTTAYTEAWAPLPSLLASLEDMLSSSANCGLSQYRVLQASSVIDLLQGCRRACELGAGCEVDRVLRFLAVLLARFRLHRRQWHAVHEARLPQAEGASTSAHVAGLVALESLLWTHVYPFVADFFASTVDQHLVDDEGPAAAAAASASGAGSVLSIGACGRAAADAVAAAAVGLTYAALLPPLGEKSEQCSGRDLCSVFAHFSSWAPDRSPLPPSDASRAVLLYVGQVLTDAELVEHLRRRNASKQSFGQHVMSLWLMACAQLPGSSNSSTGTDVAVLDDLFREIKSQDWFLTLWQLEPPVGAGVSCLYPASLLGLLDAVADANTALGVDVKARSALRDAVCELLRGLPVALSRAVRDAGGGPSDGRLEGLYYFCAHLVKSCTPLIYTKGQGGCLLTTILDRLVLPRVLFSSKKALSPIRLALMKDYLPLFLSGLSGLDYKKDAYVGRKTRDIVWNYLLKFAPSKTEDWSCHPLLAVLQPTLLSEAASTSSAESAAIRSCIIDSLVTYISDYESDNYAEDARATGLRFLNELLSRTKSGKFLLRDAAALLEFLFQCSAFSTDRPLAVCAIDVLRTLLRCLRDRIDQPALVSSDLPAVLKSYLSSSLTDAHKAAAVFDVLLKVSACCVSLVASVSSACVLVVKKLETGTRPNTALRRQCKALLQSLGSKAAGEEYFGAGGETGV